MRQRIEITKIDATNRLRPVNPTWVAAMAEQLAAGEELPAIEVVERGEGYRLIAGGHRLAAHIKIGLTEIDTDVLPAERFADEAAARLREIQENMIRYELTALDRAVHLATWKQIHETLAEPAKRGRKSKAEKTQNSAKMELRQNSAAIFVGRFSAAAAEALKISERSVRAAVQVATDIPASIRERIAFLPIADTMSELLQLAALSPERQKTVADMLAAEPPHAGSVAEAVALINEAPKPAKPERWVKLSDTFSRLPKLEQTRFFEAHRDAIAAWMAGGDA